MAGLTFGEGENVGAGNFGYIDEVEAGVDVGGKFSFQEINEDAASGRGLGVVGTDGRGGIENDDLLAVLRRGDSLLLGHELGPLVVAHHVGERNRRVFIDDDAVGTEAHGGHAGCVDETFDACVAGQPQQLARAVDVGAIHGGGIGNPETVVGGDVNDSVDPGQRRLEIRRFGEIADEGFARDALEVGEVAGFAREKA